MSFFFCLANTTGLETYVSEFQGFPITFLVSTMLPFHEGANEQVSELHLAHLIFVDRNNSRGILLV